MIDNELKPKENKEGRNRAFNKKTFHFTQALSKSDLGVMLGGLVLWWQKKLGAKAFTTQLKTRYKKRHPKNHH